MTKPILQQTSLFKQVASVLGEEEATKQLLVLIHGYNNRAWSIDFTKDVDGALYWDDSPQGFNFWDNIWTRLGY